jgi:hypothetical protein
MKNIHLFLKMKGKVVKEKVKEEKKKNKVYKIKY